MRSFKARYIDKRTGQPLLYVAAIKNKHRVVKLLMECGDRVDKANDKRGQTVLEAARICGAHRVLRLLEKECRE